MMLSWLPRSLSSFPTGYLVFLFIIVEVVLFVAFNLTNPDFDSVEDGGCSVGWVDAALSSSECKELKFRPTGKIPTTTHELGSVKTRSFPWEGLRILERKRDEKYWIDPDSPWWICDGDCNATVVVWPVGSLMEQLQVIGTVLSLAKEEGFAVKVLRDPQMRYGWDDLFDQPKMDTNLEMNEKEMEGKHELIKNSSWAGEGEGVEGICALTQWVSWSDGAIECKLSKVTAWSDVQWQGVHDLEGKRAKCIRTKHLVVREQSVMELDRTAWFLKALRPARKVREAMVGFFSEQDWLKYTWTGVHVQTNFPDLGQILPPDKAVPAEAYTQQMHRIFLTIPNHDLEIWQVLKPMRFFMVTDFAPTRAVIRKSFRRGIVVDRWELRPITDTPLSKAIWDLTNLLLLSSCRALIGTPNSLASRAATLIGDSLYTEPRQ